MVDYTRTAATAARLLKAYGVPITLTKPRTQDYEPEVGSADPLKAKTYGGFAIRDPDTDYQQTHEDGSLKRVEFAPLYVSMVDPGVPEVGDTLTAYGKTWVVDAATVFQPGPVVLMYKVLGKSP